MKNFDFRTIFNKKTRRKIWDKDEVSMKESFRFKLTLLKMIDDMDYKEVPENFLQGEFYRLSLGYRGINKNNGFVSGVQSKNSLGLKSKETVVDHLLGATLIGEHIHKEFKKNKYNIDYMVNEWLYDNLYIWSTIKITKDEHKKNNVLRNSPHSIEQKLNFEHYINVSELIY